MAQLALELTHNSQPAQRYNGAALLARLLVRHVGDQAFAHAYHLMERYRDIGGVVQAALTSTAEALQLPEAALDDLCLLQDLAVELTRERIDRRDIIGSWSTLLNYIGIRFQHRTTECFFIMLLDRKNRLIAEKILSEGSIDHAPVYPREIAKICLTHEATAIIVVHPHPSGDPTPSQADITMTKTIVDVLKPLEIVIHDHVVVGRQGKFSFKANGLL